MKKDELKQEIASKEDRIDALNTELNNKYLGSREVNWLERAILKIDIFLNGRY